MKKKINISRFIRKGPIVRLDETGSGNASLDHTHTNLPVLEALGIDANNRLTYNSEIIDVSLRQEDW